MKAFKRGKEVDVYLGHEGEVQILLPFGEHLVSIDDKNCLKIWHVRDRGWLMFYLFRFPSHKINLTHLYMAERSINLS